MFSNDLICFGIVHVLVAYQRNMCVAGPEPSPENIPILSMSRKKSSDFAIAFLQKLNCQLYYLSCFIAKTNIIPLHAFSPQEDIT
jgi:hypothetical protein